MANDLAGHLANQGVRCGGTHTHRTLAISTRTSPEIQGAQGHAHTHTHEQSYRDTHTVTQRETRTHSPEMPEKASEPPHCRATLSVEMGAGVRGNADTTGSSASTALTPSTTSDVKLPLRRWMKLAVAASATSVCVCVHNRHCTHKHTRVRYHTQRHAITHRGTQTHAHIHHTHTHRHTQRKHTHRGGVAYPCQWSLRVL